MIFMEPTPNPSQEGRHCEICQKREAEKDAKRCGYCSKRYDSQGKPFIVYSETHRYRATSKLIDNVQRNDLYFWVCDGRVGNAPVAYEQYIGITGGQLKEALSSRDYQLIEILEPVWK